MNLITVEEVRQLHAEGVKRHGGSAIVPKSADNCVDGRIGNAALAEQYVTDDERMRPGLCFAGFLLFYLVQGHCFTDGNKRVGWSAAMRVLADLGLTVEASDDEAYDFCCGITSGNVKNGRQVVKWFAQRLTAPNN